MNCVIDRLCDVLREAPTGEEIVANYDPRGEFILPRHDWPEVHPRSR